MEPPVIPKPMPASSSDLPTNHTSMLFGIVYIIFTWVIDTIILATSLWSWLAPLLWWALPAKNLAQVTPENDRPAAQDWIPERTKDTKLPAQLLAAISVPPVLQELEDRIHGVSKWAVTAYKDAQLLFLDLVVLSGVYCVNSIEIIWDKLETLPFKNILEMGWAHAAACFCFSMEHIISYILENFMQTVSKLAVASAATIKKTKILLAEFGLA
ncbi:hypothetical protein DSO57_1039267 [Entomophthora muscae]|uniref:Uncharacterized protein n=1 Tax=Entomophthora muscae TaxID=34485 RepID=A0ACC2UJN8_9FUNG|nr:hypothetical protein DSO57_1039267 [Entomophthora muscae]